MTNSRNTDEPRYIDARLHLLGRQIRDCSDIPVGVVDDLELHIGDDAPPDGPPAASSDGMAESFTAHPTDRLTALLSGKSLFVRVFGGRLPAQKRNPIPWSAVQEIDLVLRLSISGDQLPQTWSERWIRDQIIGRIPGAKHSAQ